MAYCAFHKIYFPDPKLFKSPIWQRPSCIVPFISSLWDAYISYFYQFIIDHSWKCLCATRWLPCYPPVDRNKRNGRCVGDNAWRWYEGRECTWEIRREQLHGCQWVGCLHYWDLIMGAMASQITSLTIVYSTVHSGADQRKHRSSASLAFMRGIHRWSRANGQ